MDWCERYFCSDLVSGNTVKLQQVDITLQSALRNRDSCLVLSTKVVGDCGLGLSLSNANTYTDKQRDV